MSWRWSQGLALPMKAWTLSRRLATLIRHQAAEIVEAAGMRETLTLRQGCQCPRKLGWSRASGDSCRPARRACVPR